MGIIAVENKLILPPCDFKDDEELLAWMEACRLIGIKAADELDEASPHIFATLRRYAEDRGMGRAGAWATSRSVSTQISKSGDGVEKMAGHMRVAARRMEAYVEAVEGPRRSANDFTIRSNRR